MLGIPQSWLEVQKEQKDRQHTLRRLTANADSAISLRCYTEPAASALLPPENYLDQISVPD